MNFLTTTSSTTDGASVDGFESPKRRSTTTAKTEGLNNTINDNIRPWLDLIDELRRNGIDQDVSLPQIAVMGDQSSGKSSVLEALSGIEFPRGSGIVTRCPTEVKMKRLPEGSQWRGTIRLSDSSNGDSNNHEEMLTSPTEIGRRIGELTEFLTHNSKNIEFNRSIQIEVLSPDVSDLTIIDLPGIVRRRMDGQSKTVVEDVDSLLQGYLKQERTVILAVIPSNVDIATVDILERASKVDPDFKRTIGVFTKPDMMGPGELKENVKVLKGEEASVQLSCTMLRNRGPHETDSGMTLADAKEMESNYFKTHDVFSTMDPTLFGIDHFSEKLSKILAERIEQALPGLAVEINNNLQEAMRELKGFGEAPPSDNKTMRSSLESLLHSTCKDIYDATKGQYIAKVLHDNPECRIYAKFHALKIAFKQEVTREMPTWDKDDLKEKTAAMRGRELPGFLTSIVFNGFVQEFVDSWRNPVNELLESANDMTIRACHTIIDHHTARYKKIGSDLKTIVDELLSERCRRAITPETGGLEDLFANESEPNTMNEVFMDLQNAQRVKQFNDFMKSTLDRSIEKFNPKDPALLPRKEIQAYIGAKYADAFKIGSETNEVREAEILMGMLEAYWKTKVPAFVDSAGRTVDRLLLDNLSEKVGSEFRSLIDDIPLAPYFYEQPHVMQKRRALNMKIERLTAAKKNFSRLRVLEMN